MYKYKNIYNNSDHNFINLNFIKRFRKDYINYRNYLIRLISATFYYEYFKRVNVLSNYKSVPGKNIKVIDFRLRWGYNIYLNHKKEKKINFKFIFLLCHMFKEKFKVYHEYVNLKINCHNKIYKKNIKTYKIKVLNRISNLKRFFFYRSKNFNG
jgi:hypothetical protein